MKNSEDSYSVHILRQPDSGGDSDGMGAKFLFISSQSAWNVAILPLMSANADEKKPNLGFVVFVFDFFFVFDSVEDEFDTLKLFEIETGCVTFELSL